MPWIRVDDHFDEHPKLAKVGPLGWALWLAGLAYCNRNLTDGFIPWATARKLVSWEYLRREVREDSDREVIYTVDTGTGMHGDQVTCPFVIDLLVDVGLWREIQGGYLIHDFGDYQPSKAEVLAERAKWASRQRSRRESARESTLESIVDSTESPTAPVPVPVPNGKHPLTPAKRGTRSSGTSPRQIAALIKERRTAALRELQSRYLNGELTGDQEREQRLAIQRGNA